MYDDVDRRTVDPSGMNEPMTYTGQDKTILGMGWGACMANNKCNGRARPCKLVDFPGEAHVKGRGICCYEVVVVNVTIASPGPPCPPGSTSASWDGCEVWMGEIL